jgi:hypothetical protein
MGENPGIQTALRLAQSAQAALEEAILLAPKNQGRSEISEVIKALASAGAVDLILTYALIPELTVPLKFVLPLLATYLEPDSKTIQRIELELQVLIERPLRAGLDVFQIALKLPPQDKGYRESRLRDAQRNFDEAYANIEAQKARRILTETEWLEATARLTLLRAFCAAAREGGYEEAVELSKKTLNLLKDAEHEYCQRAENHRIEQDKALTEAERLGNARNNFLAYHETEVPYPLQRDDLDDFRKDPTYHLSPEAEREWWMGQGELLISESEAKAATERDLEKDCESKSELFRGISNLIKATLLELNQRRPTTEGKNDNSQAP